MFKDEIEYQEKVQRLSMPLPSLFLSFSTLGARQVLGFYPNLSQSDDISNPIPFGVFYEWSNKLLTIRFGTLSPWGEVESLAHLLERERSPSYTKKIVLVFYLLFGVLSERWNKLLTIHASALSLFSTLSPKS